MGTTPCQLARVKGGSGRPPPFYFSSVHEMALQTEASKSLSALTPHRGSDGLGRKHDGYCTVHLCQKKYCRRRHGLADQRVTGKVAGAVSTEHGRRSSKWKLPRSERRRLAQFIRENRDPPVEKSGVGYFPIKTPDGVVEMTPIERKMYERLKGAGLNPRCQLSVGAYRIDFAFPEEKVAVEVDGARWHRDREKDEGRDRDLGALGWKVVRIRGSDAVRKDARTVLGPIFRALGMSFLHTQAQRVGGARRRGNSGRWGRHYSIRSYYGSRDRRRRV